VCVVDAVRYNRSTQTASADDVERVVRDWLRTARDRDGGRRRREPAEPSMSASAAVNMSQLPAADSSDDNDDNDEAAGSSSMMTDMEQDSESASDVEA